MKPVTGETITDEQIRELRSAYDPDHHWAVLCNYALGFYGPHVNAARACCAAAWNTKHGVKPVTTDTITDEQIRALGGPGCDRKLARLCKVALNDTLMYMRSDTVRNARARCAAAWNTKHGVDK